ncbi:hypothetical protein KW805_02685 [Candidatus Pacearchaeota archaeon]|nr:hypothetical protein [Candidatus Pacearchaeota archaeon]
MKKKGEVSSGVLFPLLFGIAGFIIILAFLFTKLDLNTYSDEELCKLSVLSRATTPGSASSLIPLKCTTKKICLSDRASGTCPQFTGEKDVATIVLDKDSTKAAVTVSEVSAQALYDCWSMMGEGKLDIFGSYATSRGFKPTEPVCVICSRVAIDRNMNQDFLKAVSDKVDIQGYLASHQVPGKSQTYMQAIGLESYPLASKEKVENALNELQKKKPKEIGNVAGSGDELALVFMQIKSTSIGSALANVGTDAVVVSGAVFSLPYVGAPLAKALLLTPAGLVVTAVVGGAVAANSAFNAYQGQQVAAGYCGKVDTRDKDSGEQGCSLVEALPYSFKDINGLCAEIEGSP